MEEHFNLFPDTTADILANLDSSSTCPHIQYYKIGNARPCITLSSSFVTIRFFLVTSHLDLLCHGNCRYELPNSPLPLYHAGYCSAPAEQMAFRALALRTSPDNLATISPAADRSGHTALTTHQCSYCSPDLTLPTFPDHPPMAKSYPEHRILIRINILVSKNIDNDFV